MNHTFTERVERGATNFRVKGHDVHQSISGLWLCKNCLSWFGKSTPEASSLASAELHFTKGRICPWAKAKEHSHSHGGIWGFVLGMFFGDIFWGD